MFKRILVAVDGSPAANAGLKSAIALAADQHAALLALHVVSDAPSAIAFEGGPLPAGYIDAFEENLQNRGRKILDKAKLLARAAAVEIVPLLVGARGNGVAGVILAQSRKLKPDVIVLGTHGRRGLQRLLMGSDAETVVREARVPVLLVRKDATRRSSSRASVKRG